MTKHNYTELIALRMTELQVSELDYIREPGETRSATIRRLISDAWVDAMMEQDKSDGYPSISDRVNCL